MAYFLGRDVKVALSTEHGTAGFTNTNGIAAVATGPTADGNNIPDIDGVTISSKEISAGVMSDVTAVDVTLGTVDEDIAYMGQRTALKAEIKKETTVTITKKRQDGFYDSMFAQGFRYGASSTSAVHDGLTQPGTTHGFRLHVVLKGASSGGENLTVPGCTFSEYSVALNADGVQEETLTFVSHITPKVADTPDKTNAIGSATFPL
tara:strand:- start:2635 stop:3252 length:618 start_codon:yes stop_codon:yes gene_type:complete